MATKKTDTTRPSRADQLAASAAVSRAAGQQARGMQLLTLAEALLGNLRERHARGASPEAVETLIDQLGDALKATREFLVGPPADKRVAKCSIVPCVPGPANVCVRCGHELPGGTKDGQAMREIVPGAGDHITGACERLVAAAPAFMVFNGVRVEAARGETASDLAERWSAEMNRRSAAHEASPEYKRQQAEDAARAARERVVREEAMASVERSGVRAKYAWTEAMQEISGFGGGYEQACRDMLYAGLAWVDAHPNAQPSSGNDAKALEVAILAVCPDCSGAMFGAARGATVYIAKNGWDAYVKAMTPTTPDPVAAAPSAKGGA